MVMLIVLSIAGCAEPSLTRLESEYKPLTRTFVQIYQGISGGVLDPSYVGTLRFPHCGRNDNDFTVRAVTGYEVYQVVQGVNGTSLRLVKQLKADDGWGIELLPGHGYGLGAGAYHLVFANETASGGNNYSIRTFHSIMNPGPEDRSFYEEWVNWTQVQRQDHWYNVTFTPFGSGILYQEGDRDHCRHGTIPSG